MAKPKSMDPVQAARKVAQKREAKRNKERKDQAQEARTLRQDTSGLERKIQGLKARESDLGQDERQELDRLEAELSRVRKIKEDFISKNPDQRNFVRGYEQDAKHHTKQSEQQQTQPHSKSNSASATAANLTNGRDPRWSIYYDAVFNPYGAPPPGMPYLEKPYEQLVAEGILTATQPPPTAPPEAMQVAEDDEQEDGEEGMDDSSEDESGDDDEDDDAESRIRDMNQDITIDGIELPEGPAPPPPLPQSDEETDSDDSSIDEELKGIVMPAGPPPNASSSGPQHLGQHVGSASPFNGRGGHAHRGGRREFQGRGQVRGRGHGRGGPRHNQLLPQRPPPALPMRPNAIQQAAPTNATIGPSLSPFPPSPTPPRPPAPGTSDSTGVVICAEPQLRDFKKEAIAFVPASIRKKQQQSPAKRPS